jgi:hypothetical protein
MSRRRKTGPQRGDRFARNGVVPSVPLPWVRRMLEVGGLAVALLARGAGAALAASTTTGTATTSVVNPGTGVAPPGSGHLTTILSYLAWCVTALCVAGVLLVAGKMAVSLRGGGHGGAEHVGALGWVLVAAVAAGSASAVVGALI